MAQKDKDAFKPLKTPPSTTGNAEIIRYLSGDPQEWQNPDKGTERKNEPPVSQEQ